MNQAFRVKEALLCRTQASFTAELESHVVNVAGDFRKRKATLVQIQWKKLDSGPDSLTVFLSDPRQSMDTTIS